jgi:hypothetical protein
LVGKSLVLVRVPAVGGDGQSVVEHGGYKVGRQNSYRIRPKQPLRHPIEAHRTVGDLIDLT